MELLFIRILFALFAIIVFVPTDAPSDKVGASDKISYVNLEEGAAPPKKERKREKYLTSYGRPRKDWPKALDQDI